jgi:hypothetical protein
VNAERKEKESEGCIMGEKREKDAEINVLVLTTGRGEEGIFKRHRAC